MNNEYVYVLVVENDGSNDIGVYDKGTIREAVVRELNYWLENEYNYDLTKIIENEGMAKLITAMYGEDMDESDLCDMWNEYNNYDGIQMSVELSVECRAINRKVEYNNDSNKRYDQMLDISKQLKTYGTFV